MHFRNVFVILSILCYIATPAAIAETRHTATLHAGFSFPFGDYAQRTDTNNSGFAKLGFGGGFEYDLLFGDPGLSWSSSFAYLSNEHQADYFSRGLKLVMQEGGTYSNYAFLTGVKYEKNFGDNFRLFAAAQGGVSLSRGPYISGFLDTENEDVPFIEYQVGNGSSTGFSVALGMVANETTTISLRYFNLGTHSYSGTVEYEGNDIDKIASISWEQPVSMIFLTIGYTIDFGF
jgi:hypothetical protein